MDVFDERKRSEVMSRIRSKGTRSTEGALKKLLLAANMPPWDEWDPTLPGRPDFVFPEHRVAVFVDGCFWHGCPHCYDGHAPKSNSEYWARKIAANKARDRRTGAALRRRGWSVIRIWECRLKTHPRTELRRLQAKLHERLPDSCNPWTTSDDWNSECDLASGGIT